MHAFYPAYPARRLFNYEFRLLIGSASRLEMHGDVSWFDIQTRACKAIGDVAFHLRADVMSVFKTYFNRQRNRGFDKNLSSDAAHLDFVAAKHAFCVDGGPPYTCNQLRRYHISKLHRILVCKPAAEARKEYTKYDGRYRVAVTKASGNKP